MNWKMFFNSKAYRGIIKRAEISHIKAILNPSKDLYEQNKRLRNVSYQIMDIEGIAISNYGNMFIVIAKSKRYGRKPLKDCYIILRAFKDGVPSLYEFRIIDSVKYGWRKYRIHMRPLFKDFISNNYQIDTKCGFYVSHPYNAV